jgi:hypothetical protein
VNLIDPQGDSIIVNKWGYILSEEGEDNKVLLQKENYLEQLGFLGDTIDVDEIYSYLLETSIREYKYLDPVTVYNLVRNGGPHDLKNNTRTIYGLANKTNTLLYFKGVFMSAQDIGNHHFGVATAANIFIAPSFALRMAGLAQIKAGTSDPKWIVGKWGLPLSPPYGDDPVDQYWIKSGVNYYKKTRK